MADSHALSPDQLYRHCDDSAMTFETTADLDELQQPIGQTRAAEAVQFATEMTLEGYNLFVLGPAGTGRHHFVEQYLSTLAHNRPEASDWLYVNNFNQPHRPHAIELPAGRGEVLCDDVAELIEAMQTTIPAAFESDDYRLRREALERNFQTEQNAAFEAAQAHAEERGIRVLQTPNGFAFAPVREGEVMGPEEFQKLPESEQESLRKDITEISEEFQRGMQGTPKRLQALQVEIKKLDQEVASLAIDSLIDDLASRYDDLSNVVLHLSNMRDDVRKNFELFRSQPDASTGDWMQRLGAGAAAMTPHFDVNRRYGLNLFVDNEPDGAPIVIEDRPSYTHLIGKIEHRAEFGTMSTDFTLLKPGAMHRANGGFLIIDAQKLLSEPFAWNALKQALKSGHVALESLDQAYNPLSTVSLEPEPIRLNIKVVLIGERYIYYLLQRLDPEFSDLFKVAADFDDRMAWSPDNEMMLARFVAGIAKRDQLAPLNRAAVGRIIESTARRAGDTKYLSTEVRYVADIVREANHSARKDERNVITADDVDAAIANRKHRNLRVQDRIHSETLRGTIRIDTEGSKEGQINGLAVSQIGEHAFGHPTRITARIAIGAGKIIDIEREVELGGPLHSKGVMILSGYLSSHFLTDQPLSLSATLVFEQSYGGVDGDSASSAELYALLSAIANVPLRQDIAVTGSVDQHGNVQAIGGVNEKVEGFFDLCRDRGFNGTQGVLIPSTNVGHLMLRSDVVDAVRQGQFAIHAVSAIDEGVEIMTGLKAGRRSRQGNFPNGSFNQKVARGLGHLAEKRASFTQR